MEHEERPWGWYKVLVDTPTYKVKLIQVNPNSRLSLQSHQFRKEHWYVVSGQLTVEVGIDQSSLVKFNCEVNSINNQAEISLGYIHRASNETENPAQFIEIQTGEYFGEDDIVRYEDDYGRS